MSEGERLAFVVEPPLPGEIRQPISRYGMEEMLCAFCKEPATDFVSTLYHPYTGEPVTSAHDGRKWAGGVCPAHGGPRYPVELPPNADEIEARIRADAPEYLHDLIPNYRAAGFNYGYHAAGFRRWGYAVRVLADIGPSRPMPKNRRSWLDRLRMKA